MTWTLGHQWNSRRSNRSHQASCAVQQLESRLVPSTTQVIDVRVVSETLQITGTSLADRVEVANDSSGTLVTTNNPSQGTRSQYVSGFRSILFRGGDSGDYFRNDLDTTPLTAYGGIGDDTLIGGQANDLLVGDGALDTIEGRGGNDTIWGDGIGQLEGTPPEGDANASLYNDYLDGGDGDDVIYGGFGNDSIYGGNNNDTLYGGAHHDLIFGLQDSNWIYGGTGNDTLNGSIGIDVIFGDADHDIISGDSGNDSLYGGTGNDTLRGGNGNDFLRGDADADRLEGEANSDTLRGSAGFDALFGGRGNDFLFGEADSDELYGEDDDDWLEAGSATEVAIGGNGIDYNAHVWTINGINQDDIDQHQSGTCSFLSSLAAVTRYPEFDLNNRIRYIGNFTYTVQLYDPATKQWIAVRASFNGSLVRTTMGELMDPYRAPSATVPDGEFWVLLYQRAYVARFLGLNPLDANSVKTFNGETGVRPLEVLTGRKISTDQLQATWFLDSDTSPEDLARRVSAGPVTAGSSFTDSAGKRLGHAFAVNSVFQRSGVWMVELYNPWGTDTSGGTGFNGISDGSAEDGIITLRWSQFMDKFQVAYAYE